MQRHDWGLILGDSEDVWSSVKEFALHTEATEQKIDSRCWRQRQQINQRAEERYKIRTSRMTRQTGIEIYSDSGRSLGCLRVKIISATEIKMH